MESLPMLALMLIIVGLCGREAWLDRTPRKPFSWHRPDLEWWTTRRTHRERKRSAMPMDSEKAS